MDSTLIIIADALKRAGYDPSLRGEGDASEFLYVVGSMYGVEIYAERESFHVEVWDLADPDVYTESIEDEIHGNSESASRAAIRWLAAKEG